ncbi:ABC transporter permease subunit [Paenibacillus gansuensis]|uniref:ABC transporter permease subunit n=1 Tax=Paenibacillus gansuensis TaxID=306542 RepID=A0ABW5P9V1_9BACL
MWNKLAWNRALWSKDYKQAKFLLWMLPVITFLFMGFSTYFSLLAIDDDTLKWRLADLEDGVYQLSAITNNEAMLRVALAIVVILLAALLIGGERRGSMNDFSFSLPYTRSELFFSKWKIGAVFLIASVLVNVLIDIGFTLASKFAPYLELGYYMKETGSMTIALLALFTFALVVGTFTGNWITQVVLTGIFSVFPFGFYFICTYGFMIHAPAVRAARWNIEDNPLFIFASNMSLGIHILDYTPLEHIYAWVPVVMILILLPLGAWIYERNKIENNGKMVIFPIIEPVLKWGVVVCCGLTGGMFFEGISYGDMNKAEYYTGFLLAAAAAYLVMRFVIRRRFRERS